MTKLGDVLTISANKSTHISDKNWLLNLDMVQQQTGKILAYNYVTANELCGSIIGFDNNVVLYSKLRPNLNKVVLPDKYGFCTSELLPLLPDSKQLNREYLAWFLRSDSFVNWAATKTAGAKMPRLGTKELLSKEIPLPDLPTQQRIADTLDKVSEGIEVCRKMLGELDLMVKAKFVEMFGDVFDNPKNFEMRLFGDYASQMNIGPFGSDLKNDCFVSKENGYCMVYEQKHAIDKNILVEARYVTEEKYQQMKRFDIGPGDIIVSCRGTIGKCFILPDDAPHGIIHPSLMMIKPKSTVNSTFLLFLLESILKEQQEQGTGVKMAIKASELAKIKCITPPRELQDSYVMFISQINKSKLTIQGILDKMETEKLALMQAYFNTGI